MKRLHLIIALASLCSAYLYYIPLTIAADNNIALVVKKSKINLSAGEALRLEKHKAPSKALPNLIGHANTGLNDWGEKPTLVKIDEKLAKLESAKYSYIKKIFGARILSEKGGNIVSDGRIPCRGKHPPHEYLNNIKMCPSGYITTFWFGALRGLQASNHDMNDYLNLTWDVSINLWKKRFSLDYYCQASWHKIRDVNLFLRPVLGCIPKSGVQLTGVKQYCFWGRCVLFPDAEYLLGKRTFVSPT